MSTELSEALIRKIAKRIRKPDEKIDENDDIQRYIREASLALRDRRFQSREDLIERLTLLRKELLREVDFSDGDIVQWKDGLRNRAYPAYGEPVVVVEILPEPVYGDDDSGTPQFREPLDLVLGWLDKEGDMVCFHYDKRRFRKFVST